MKLDSNALIEKLRKQAKKHKLTKSALAAKAGLDNKTLQFFWESDWNPTLDTIEKLEAVFK